MNTICFTTIVSDEFLYRCIVLYKSLIKTCRDFEIYVLCMEKDSYDILRSLKLNRMHCLELDAFENADLLAIKKDRNIKEYIWTIKPNFLYYIMTNYPGSRYYAHIDTDVCFFGDPCGIFNENPDASLFITKENNSHQYAYFDEFCGVYNSGFVGCKADDTGRAAIKWLGEKAIEWCYDRYDFEGKRFGEQRYLEEWPSMYSNVHVVENPGVNAAPWSIDRYQVRLFKGITYLDKHKLIFFHFSTLKIFNSVEFEMSWYFDIKPSVIRNIYEPYLKHLSKTMRELEIKFPTFKKGISNKNEDTIKHYFRFNL